MLKQLKKFTLMIDFFIVISNNHINQISSLSMISAHIIPTPQQLPFQRISDSDLPQIDVTEHVFCCAELIPVYTTNLPSLFTPKINLYAESSSLDLIYQQMSAHHQFSLFKNLLKAFWITIFKNTSNTVLQSEIIPTCYAYSLLPVQNLPILPHYFHIF